MAQHQENNSSSIKYGELFPLGYGFQPEGDDAMRPSHSLFQRATANGVKPSTVHMGCNSQGAKAISVMDQHSISFKEETTTVVVEYTCDKNTDMFQIGRSTESDFLVTDMVGDHQEESYISLFACRIVCQRSPPYAARIYAAGFNSAKNIALGVRAVKWKSSDGQMDGLTTNGVLVLHPPRSLPDQPSLWREISVCGDVFTLRKNTGERGDRVTGESQELVDGSLIDLCGVTLLWRTAEGLARTPIMEHLDAQRQEIYPGRPVFVYKPRKDDEEKERERATPAPVVLSESESAIPSPVVLSEMESAIPSPVVVPVSSHGDMCEHTLDPHTAHKELSLFNKNRTVACMANDHQYPDHQDRFQDYRQVMCAESLTGLCYWEVEWSGWVEIAVSYGGIDRAGFGSLFGRNDKSWCLKCYGGIAPYSVSHDSEDTELPAPPPSDSGRVRVSVDCPAGTVSFFSVSADASLTHLHTFRSKSKFTEPLYAGFSVLWNESSLVL